MNTCESSALADALLTEDFLDAVLHSFENVHLTETVRRMIAHGPVNLVSGNLELNADFDIYVDSSESGIAPPECILPTF